MLWAKITGEFEGIHFYKKAQGEEKFLQHPHRHMFHYTIMIEQFHDDRDIEYIAFKRWIEKLIKTKGDLNHKSCEMIARELSKEIRKKYPGRYVKIEIMEDGENGTLLEKRYKG